MLSRALRVLNLRVVLSGATVILGAGPGCDVPPLVNKTLTHNQAMPELDAGVSPLRPAEAHRSQRGRR